MASPEPIIEFVEAPDRWRLATYHYPHRSRSRSPVILVHGLGTNRFDVDFPDPRLSLAKYLHGQGFDTWVIELRGTGRSHKDSWLARCRTKLKSDWTFDDYIFKDLPALVQHISKKSGKKKFHWIGHSLGGTVVYAAIEHLGSSVCASGVTLGAAMSASARPGYVKMLLKIDSLIKRMPCMPVRPFAQVGARIGRWVAPLNDNFVYAFDNVEIKTLETGLKVAVENWSSPLFLQLHQWYRTNHFTSLDGSFNYKNRLKEISAPFLVCAGSVDGMTPYPDVHFAFRKIRSKDKRFLVFGRDHGCRTEYAHIDLVLGKNAPREVFPAIAEWMKSHD